VKQKKLNITRLIFSKNRSVGDLRKESSEILQLSGNYVYLLCSDGCENPYDDELIQDKLDYYLDPESYFPDRDISYQTYFDTDFVLNYKRVFSSQFYQKLRIPNDYTILKVYDVKTLNFFLSVDNDEEIHIFSSDYDISFLETFLDEYYHNKIYEHTLKIYEYVLEKYTDYFATKNFIFYDTYADDEEDNYLFISKNPIPKIFKEK